MTIISSKFVKGVMGTDPTLYDGVPQIAFVGRSNVGKSSVINSLMNGMAMAKVSKKPGKTVELNIFDINNGQAYFIDLPGYGFAKVTHEMREKIVKLIRWYLTYSEIKPLKVVLVLDIKAGLTAFDEETIGILEEYGHPYVIVANKIDKLNRKELAEQLALIKEKSRSGDIVRYSAKTGAGAEMLLEKLFVL